ncbi:PREDICTED: uncharacterized protein LOC109238392 [Nicotiana attenuata]|uniref:uncharacterized protein LOC109238392 n=1 Tax=Nicotiana attenuata TaxID=49451 RepID=UPI000904D075|nr:PREDICTED: uncharacterized protein LOC109238392 [Nicotiana attenuata]
MKMQKEREVKQAHLALEISKLVRVMTLKRVGATPYLMDNIGCWNVRGLNRTAKQKEVNLFLHNVKAGLFEILETKIKRTKAQQASLNLCTGWSFSTNLHKHPRGRIWLLWKPHIYEVDIITVTAQIIHCQVKHGGRNEMMHITVVYGFDDQALRRNLWEEIRKLYSQVQGPWSVMGDFNCVLHKEERIGSPVTVTEIRDFKSCVETCDLHDLKSTGAYFTWNNKQEGEDKVMSKIDRVLVNSDWVTNLPASTVHYIEEGLYDHCPAIISWEKGGNKKEKQFKYFNIWSMAPEFSEKVEESWQVKITGCKQYQLVGKLNRLKRVLGKINKNRFSEVEKKADQAKQELTECQARIQANPRDHELHKHEKELARAYSRWEEARYRYLRQKSKILWAEQGDHNTRYFHNNIKARRNNNRIFSIKDADGVNVTDMEKVATTFIEFYTSLLGTSKDDRYHVCRLQTNSLLQYNIQGDIKNALPKTKEGTA